MREFKIHFLVYCKEKVQAVLCKFELRLGKNCCWIQMSKEVKKVN